MNLSENQKVVDDLKQILEYYDYLEYDENLSAGPDQLCLKVSDPDANCHLGVIKNICAQLGSEYTCEPERSTRFYIRLKDHNDYPSISTIQHQEERLHPEPDSATAYYYRGLVKSIWGNMNLLLKIIVRPRRLSTARDKLYAMVLLHQLLAKKAEDQSNRIRFYKTYENLGQELLSDLVALCKNCHDGYHGRLPTKYESFWHMRA